MTNRRVLQWVLVAAALIISFIVGTRVGIDQHLKMDSSLKAAKLVLELRALREGRGQSLIEHKEVELDGEIVSAITFQDSGAPWLFWPHAHDIDHKPSLSIPEVNLPFQITHLCLTKYPTSLASQAGRCANRRSAG